MKKYFIITVDTEGDNLWAYKPGDKITTKNAQYIKPFQALCEKYGYKPVYLTNYEMAQDSFFVKEANEWLKRDACEIGVHLHAWNNPPSFKLDGPYYGNPYLIEYPDNVMYAKFKVIYDLLVENFGIKPVSHRAGRWAMDDRYFRLLEQFGILVDCSHTPGVSWESEKGVSIGGSDYRNVAKIPSKIGRVLEVPIPILRSRLPFFGNIRRRVRGILKGNAIYLRPASSSLSEMKYYIDKFSKSSEYDYVEFMIHSSELMPNGSPYFPDVKSVDNFLHTMDELFKYACGKGFEGITLKNYYNRTNK